MLPLFYRKWVPRDTMCPTAPPMVFSYVMLYGRDLIRVLRFPLLEASGWISLARSSHLDCVRSSQAQSSKKFARIDGRWLAPFCAFSVAKGCLRRGSGKWGV